MPIFFYDFYKKVYYEILSNILFILLNRKIKGSDNMDFIIDSSILQSLLLSVIFLAILVEIKTGGTGIGALLGIIAAGVFFAVVM